MCRAEPEHSAERDLAPSMLYLWGQCPQLWAVAALPPFGLPWAANGKDVTCGLSPTASGSVFLWQQHSKDWLCGHKL